MWTVRVLEGADLVVGELEVQRRDGVGEVMRLGGPTMGAVTTGFFSTQARATCAIGDAASLGDLLYGVDDGPVAVDVESSPDWIDVEALACVRPRAGQAALGKRAVRDAADSLVGEQAEHLALFLALHQVVLVLHGDEPGPAVQVGDVLHLGELPGPHRRGADVAGLAGLDDVVQGLHGLLDRRVGVEAVDLVEVDVVGAEAGQEASICSMIALRDRPAPPGTVVHLEIHLGGQDDVVAAAVLLQRPADDLLRAAGAVDVGGVPEGDAELDGLLEERLGGPRRPGPIR